MHADMYISGHAYMCKYMCVYCVCVRTFKCMSGHVRTRLSVLFYYLAFRDSGIPECNP